MGLPSGSRSRAEMLPSEAVERGFSKGMPAVSRRVATDAGSSLSKLSRFSVN